MLLSYPVLTRTYAHFFPLTHRLACAIGKPDAADGEVFAGLYRLA